jgi:glutathionylspermidine synthase
VVVRHYKTDWWGERLPVWKDEAPYPDAAPLTEPLSVLLRGLLGRRCAVVNPFGAVLTQNKRSLAFMWERMSAFSPDAQAAIRAFIPQTFRRETLEMDQLMDEQRDWVLKSDYGCEGDEVIIGADCTSGDWRAIVDNLIDRRWVVQRFFRARRDGQGYSANHGVFLVAGQAAGIYTRLSVAPTDHSALSVPTRVRA